MVPTLHACMTRASLPQVMKLSSVKSEVRYSPNMILVKMIGSYSISQVILRISDINRTKMVDTYLRTSCQQ